jgi:predicted Zn finger-like uncharacterized protein
VYTQCSKCETVFRLSAEVLRAAGGQVRCGRCGEVFNALARLAEDSSSFASGESPLDLEARADSILESVAAPQVAHTVAKDYEEFAHPGVEIAQLEVLDWSEDDQADRRAPAPPASPIPPIPPAPPAPPAPTAPASTPAAPAARTAPVAPGARVADEHTLEFTLPPGELDRIFVESKRRAPKRPPSTAPAPPEVEVDVEPEGKSAPEPEVEAPPHPESAAVPTVDRRRRGGGFVSEEVRREVLEGIQRDIEPDFELQREVPFSPRGPDPRWRFALWLAGSIAAAVLLIVQILFQNREWFVAHTHAPANLSAYQLRQWGVTGDPEAHGKLRLRASILNTAAQLQPYPLLRVTLADRFGKSIGTRDFEPSEYLGRPTARMLAPGERADANLEILDPGKNAEGFEIDVCMRGVGQRVSCAADVAAQPKQSAAP